MIFLLHLALKTLYKRGLVERGHTYFFQKKKLSLSLTINFVFVQVRVPYCFEFVLSSELGEIECVLSLA